MDESHRNARADLGGGSVSWRPDPLAQGKELGHSSNWSKLGGTPGEGMLTEVAAVGSAGCHRRGWRPSAPPIFIRNRDLEPIVTQFGYDPIWFIISVGVVMVEDGSIHPPVGMNLFVVQAQAPRCQDH